MSPLISIRDLDVEYGRGRKANRVISDLNLDVMPGETLGIVGESGSGKSTLASVLVGLVKPVAGSVTIDGREVTGLSSRNWRELRANIQLVFQNPLLSLSPRRSIRQQLEEPLRVHTNLTRSTRADKIAELLAQLELSGDVLGRHPHELSGGQAQRVVLARALSLEPAVILFDEPTSALDVSVQAGVLNLLQRLKRERELTYVFITHDLGVALHLSDRIAVMREGEIVELAQAETLFANPEQSYTQSLVASSPTI